MTTDEILNEIDYIINYLYAMRHNDRLPPHVLRIQAGNAALRLEVARDRLATTTPAPAPYGICPQCDALLEASGCCLECDTKSK